MDRIYKPTNASIIIQDRNTTGTDINTGSYSELQYKHKQLQHEYGILQNQFQIYTTQTYNRIQSLQRNMDNLVEQKDRTIKSITLQNKNLKEQNIKQRAQIEQLLAQVDKINNKLKSNEQQFRSTVFNHQKIQSRQRQIVMNFQRQLSIKIQQMQSLKQILNNERITVINKQQLLINKDNEITQLITQLKQTHIQLENRRQVEQAIKDSNYKLKRQVEQLTAMFRQVQKQFRVCQKCKILEIKNMQLSAIIRSLQDKENRNYIYVPSGQNNRRASHIKTQFSMQKRPYRNRYIGDRTLQTIGGYENERQSFNFRNLKDSVVKRCRVALDKS